MLKKFYEKHNRCQNISHNAESSINYTKKSYMKLATGGDSLGINGLAFIPFGNIKTQQESDYTPLFIPAIETKGLYHKTFYSHN